MITHKVLMLGASAGGIEIISKFLEGFPKNLNVAIVIVIHLPGDSNSMLEQILARRTGYPVITVSDNLAYEPDHIYLSPCDQHILINETNIYPSTGPKINRFRPSIDVAFNSAAFNCHSRVIGILFSGLLADGIQGLNAIKQNGGITIVQDPVEAPYPDLPLNAIREGSAQHVLTLEKMLHVLPKLINQSKPRKLKPSTANQKARKLELDGSIGKQTYPDYLNEIGKVSHFTCPDCYGTLWEIKDGKRLNLRCRTGHQYNLESLQKAQTDTLENILWSAVRALEESHDLSNRIAQEFRNNKMPRAEKLYQEKAKKANTDATLIRDLIVSENVIIKNSLP